LGTICLEDVVQPFGTPEEEKRLMDALDPENADDRLDALIAAGWTVRYLHMDYALVPPFGRSYGGARRLD
jgi:hypothetical protein